MASDLNPLLEDFDFPPYHKIHPHHIRPGIQSLLTKLEIDLVELETNLGPTWPKLVEPLEKIIDKLNVVWGIVNHLSAVKDSPELRSAIEEVQPDKVKFQLRLQQSKPTYHAFKAIRESPNWESLNIARKRIVEAKIKEAVLNGVSLEGNRKEQFNAIQQELEKLAQKFEENMLDATKKFEKLIINKKDLEGMPDTALAMAAQTAVSKGHGDATSESGPWIFTLDGPSYRSVMKHARNRSLREELYRAYITRASSGDFNNTPIIDKILQLRLQQAKLLGYNNYAELSMEMKMATLDKAEELVEELRGTCWKYAVRDMEELQSFTRLQNVVESNDLNHWDLNFWSERLRESIYDINEEELRPYFSLPNVIDGLFSLTEMLFAVKIEPADGLAPVWNSDVRFFRVKDSCGDPAAYFYFDPYSRPSEKRGGAWMDKVFGRTSVITTGAKFLRLPVAHIVCNQTPPMAGKPSLMTFREVETIFHELGHALQHLLTKQDEGLVSGTRGIEWDALELPSQFMENWCYQRNTIMSIAKHYITGESLPEEVCSKLILARTFRAGSEILRQLRFAGVDLELYSKYVPGGTESIYDIDQRVGKRTHVIPLQPEDRFLCCLSHIFADKYAAGYFSYYWAEVLSADAFSAFEEAGLDNEKAIKAMGIKFRDTVLAYGGGKPPLEVKQSPYSFFSTLLCCWSQKLKSILGV